jgi:hypothetical protein
MEEQSGQSQAADRMLPLKLPFLANEKHKIVPLARPLTS